MAWMWISIAALLGFCLLGLYSDTRDWGEAFLPALAGVIALFALTVAVGGMVASRTSPPSESLVNGSSPLISWLASHWQRRMGSRAYWLPKSTPIGPNPPQSRLPDGLRRRAQIRLYKPGRQLAPPFRDHALQAAA